MLEVKDKEMCCGCTACESVCPKQCIRMVRDSEGFLYPQVDASKCVECGLCERACPFLNQGKERKPVETLAAVNRDEAVRQSSSSGGVFQLMADWTLRRGGIVFGARFESDGSVVHAGADTPEGVARFRGSKYVQSRMGDVFKRVKAELDGGRRVMFSGTPCQVAGLKRYLRRDYENLLAVDFVCHGVPSPLAWEKYLEETMRPKGAGAGKNTVSVALNDGSGPAGADISFRDKRSGWKKFGFRLSGSVARQGDENSVSASGIDLWEQHDRNRYMQIFLGDMSLRPSCFNCRTKGGSSGADVTIGDFWGIEHIDPSIDDDGGCSLVLVNNPAKVNPIFEESDCIVKAEDYDKALRFNPSIERPVTRPPYRNLFMSQLQTRSFSRAYDAVKSMKFLRRVYRRVWLVVNG